MKKANVESFAYKIGSWLAIVTASCIAACLTGLAISVTVWILRALFTF